MNDTPTDRENSLLARRVHGSGYHLDFSVGQRCLVQFEQNGQKFKASIIGLEHYAFVIARLPLVPGITNRMRPGYSVIIRMEQAGTVYGFTSEILSCMLRPAPILVFNYPTSVEGLQYREHKRTQCMLPVKIQNSFLDTDGLVTNISTGGCGVVIDWQDKEQAFNFMTGDNLELSIHLKGDASHTVPAKTMNVRELKRHFLLGLKFEAQEQLKSLADFIAKLESAWAALGTLAR